MLEWPRCGRWRRRLPWSRCSAAPDSGEDDESTRFDAESYLITVVFHFCMRVDRNEKGGPVLYATLRNEKFGAQFRTWASVLYTLRRRTNAKQTKNHFRMRLYRNAKEWPY